MSQEEQEQQQKILDPKSFQTQFFFVPKFFLDKLVFQAQIFSDQKFVWTFFLAKIIFGLIFLRPKTMFGGVEVY